MSPRSPSFVASIGLLLPFQFLDDPVQLVETSGPELVVSLDPCRLFLESTGVPITLPSNLPSRDFTSRAGPNGDGGSALATSSPKGMQFAMAVPPISTCLTLGGTHVIDAQSFCYLLQR